jgi:hypothetical protein
MAGSTINGIQFNYPDSPCMVFNPCIVTVGITVARVRIGISGIYATYQGYNGECTVDIRAFLQAGFTDLKMGRDNLESFGMSELGKDVSVTIAALAEDNSVLAQYTATIFCIWGGMAINEEVNNIYKLTMWAGYPFSVGRYFDVAEDVDVEGMTYNVTERGVWNIPITPLNGDVVITKHGTSIKYASIKVKEHRDGMYLRWVDRHGFWRYWLFKIGDPQREAASRFGMFSRIDWGKYNATYGWQGASGRRQSFTRNDIIPVCAPLVDQDTFDMLQDVTTSPCVDMLVETVPYNWWTAVTVQPGTYTKEVDKPEQDFILNVVMPEIPIQSL